MARKSGLFLCMAARAIPGTRTYTDTRTDTEIRGHDSPLVQSVSVCVSPCRSVCPCQSVLSRTYQNHKRVQESTTASKEMRQCKQDTYTADYLLA